MDTDTTRPAHLALRNAIYLATNQGTTMKDGLDIIAELAEQGFAIVPVEPLIPTITVHDPLGEVGGSHRYATRREFEVAVARLHILAAMSQARAEVTQPTLADGFIEADAPHDQQRTGICHRCGAVLDGSDNGPCEQHPAFIAADGVTA